MKATLSLALGWLVVGSLAGCPGCPWPPDSDNDDPASSSSSSGGGVSSSAGMQLSSSLAGSSSSVNASSAAASASMGATSQATPSSSTSSSSLASSSPLPSSSTAATSSIGVSSSASSSAGSTSTGAAQTLADGFVFALDVRDRKVAWASLTDRKVRLANADGSGPVEVAQTPTVVTSIAIADGTYFVQPGTSPIPGSIVWHAPTPGAATELSTGFYGERVVSDGATVFWTDETNTRLVRRTATPSVTYKTVRPLAGAAFELDATHLYFVAQDTDSTNPALWRVSKDFTGEPERVVSSADVGGATLTVNHVAIDDNKVYVAVVPRSGSGAGRLLRKNKDGTGATESVAAFSGNEQPTCVAVSGPKLFYVDSFLGRVLVVDKTAINQSAVLFQEGGGGNRCVVSNGYLYYFSPFGLFRAALPG